VLEIGINLLSVGQLIQKDVSITLEKEGGLIFLPDGHEIEAFMHDNLVWIGFYESPYSYRLEHDEMLKGVTERDGQDDAFSDLEEVVLASSASAPPQPHQTTTTGNDWYKNHNARPFIQEPLGINYTVIRILTTLT